MHVQPMRERHRRAGLHVRIEFLAVQVALALIRGQHHHDVGPFGALGRVHDFQSGGLGFRHALRAGPQTDREVLRAAVLQVVGMGVTLAAISDDGDVLRLDQIDVGVAIVIDAHWFVPFHSILSVARIIGEPVPIIHPVVQHRSH